MRVMRMTMPDMFDNFDKQNYYNKLKGTTTNNNWRFRSLKVLLRG